MIASTDCCGRSPHRTMTDYIDLGLRRRRRPPFPTKGLGVNDDEGLSACFSLKLENGEIAGVSFECSSCVTLVAYCELLCETVEHETLRSALRLTPAGLAAELPEVPPYRRDRALLAVAAFHKAIARAVSQESL